MVNNNGCPSEPSDTISITITGTESNSIAQFIQIYLNPVDGILHIQSNLENAFINYEIYNIKFILSGRFTGTTHINVKKLAKGVYSIYLSTDKGITYLRFLQKKLSESSTLIFQ